MTGAARLGLERGLERREASRRRALGDERPAPVTAEELLNRLGAGGVDGTERREHGDQHRRGAKHHGVEVSSARSGCYSFLRTRAQNPRGAMVLVGAAAATTRR